MAGASKEIVKRERTIWNLKKRDARFTKFLPWKCGNEIRKTKNFSNAEEERARSMPNAKHRRQRI
jgi:hypothetical protein